MKIILKIILLLLSFYPFNLNSENLNNISKKDDETDGFLWKKKENINSQRNIIWGNAKDLHSEFFNKQENKRE